jgi:hypothetical protein
MFRGTLFTIVSSGDVAAFDQLIARQPRLDLKMKMGEHGQSNTPTIFPHIGPKISVIKLSIRFQ